ncbi:MAG: nucleotidyltransferase domain-containing protein [Epsilonproteobacteria bacterium]|nr:nucleotidyltransferase domain-containing protein [Campylobacterota bacterium]
MISSQIIDEVKKRLIETYDPIAIYLFGSYASGKQTDDSDLDLVVIVETSNEKTYKRPIKGHKALFGLGIAKDLIVYTQEEFNKFSREPSSLCHQIHASGKLIYAKS